MEGALERALSAPRGGRGGEGTSASRGRGHRALAPQWAEPTLRLACLPLPPLHVPQPPPPPLWHPPLTAPPQFYQKLVVGNFGPAQNLSQQTEYLNFYANLIKKSDEYLVS